MRLFVAVFPPEPERAHLRQCLTAGGRRRAAFRLTPVQRWHVTLAFLGEVPATRLPEVERAVASVRRREPICLRIAGGGSFGGRRGSRVLWAGLDGDVPALVSMQANLRMALEAAGLPHDERPFTPHLTVAYADSAPVRAALDSYTGPPWQADELVLVHSRPPEGYTHLRTWSITSTP